MLLYAFALYVAVGAIVAIAFISAGLSRVLPPTTTVSLGARILILPGSVALWPYVLARWLKAEPQP